MLWPQFSVPQTTSFLSTAIQCVPGSTLAPSRGMRNSCTAPVFGSSRPMIGAAVRAVPDVALRIGHHVVGGELEPRQFILGDDHARRPALRPRQGDERRVLGVRPAHGREPLHEPRGVLVVEASTRPHVDQGRARALGHAVDDVAPARLVVVVAEDLLIRMAPVAVDGEELLLVAGAGQAHEPFRAGHLRGDLGRMRQQFAIRDAREHDLLQLVAPLIATFSFTKGRNSRGCAIRSV